MPSSQPQDVTGISLALLQELQPWIAQVKLVADSAPLPYCTRKYRALDHMGRPFAIVLCSPPESKQTVAVDLERRMLARRELGSLSTVVLEPLKYGMAGDLSYAVYPICRRLFESRIASAVERVSGQARGGRLAPVATQKTVDWPTDQERANLFVAPLGHLTVDGRLPEDVRHAALVALRRLEQGSWRPRVCLMHGDLWKGNVLLSPRSRNPRHFLLIDWAGSLLRGHAIFDLVRLAISMRLKGRRFERELLAHCQILGCDIVDTFSYLLSALGYFQMNMDSFPFERFMSLMLDSFHYLNSLGEQAVRLNRRSLSSRIASYSPRAT